MKRVISLILVVSMVMCFGVQAMASANRKSKEIDVELTILPYAYVEGPDKLVLDDIDFSDEEYTARKSERLTFYANTDFGMEISSRGFEDLEGQRSGLLNGWQNWTGYTLYRTGGGEILSTYGGGHRETLLRYTGKPWDLTLVLKLQASKDNWYEVKAGTYTDVLMITIWAN